jgi:hypothetical protein
MDEKPFLEVDLLDIDENIIPELKKLTKSSFDFESIINAAGELKYVSQIKKILHSQLNNPEDDFVKFFASRVYDGILTQKVRESFLNLTKKAASQYINDQVNERLKSAITGVAPAIIETQMSHLMLMKRSRKMNTMSLQRQRSLRDTISSKQSPERYLKHRVLLTETPKATLVSSWMTIIVSPFADYISIAHKNT